MFPHLHINSHFSPMWGLHSLETLCRAARDMGVKKIALTDRNGLYGIPLFLQVAKENGIEPIIGAEALTADHRAVILARDAEGYANLCRLLSDLHCRDTFHLPSALQRYREGIVIISDDADLLAPLRHQSREALFVEASPGHRIDRALTLAKRLDLPPIATCRGAMLKKDELQLHRVLRAIHLNTKLSRLTTEQVAGENDILLPPEKLAAFFPDSPQAMENSVKAAELCCTDWDFSKTVFPAYGNLRDDEAYAELEHRARRGAIGRYGNIDERIEQRLQKELALIKDKGFAHYFLVVEEITKQSKLTCGRGSAAASLVAFSLGITHVDPLKHNLFFERFLNEGRTDPPDIDIDFPWDEREDILHFAFARYGTRRAAMVANHVGFKGRAALREVAKVYGVQDAGIKEITDRISGFWKADQTAGAVTEHPLFQGDRLSPEWQEIISIASRLTGNLRHLSLHCGGLIIVPDEINRYVPVEVSAKGLPVIQWEKDQAEDAGLVKIDILGNRSLAVIRDTLAAIERYNGKEIDYASWDPLADKKTINLLQQGRTMGCFYVESPSIRLLLRKIWGENPEPKTLELDIFEILVQTSSIIRPAANSFIIEYVARLRGKQWESPHPLLSEVLEETYGIAIYQEQITQLAMALADFSPYHGDQLRKVISKKHKAKKLEDYRRQFFSGGEKKGIPAAVLKKTWEQILSFSGYSFCKPHSASYVLVSAKAAWLKANYPAEFMAAVISNQGGYYSPFAYISESRRLGLKILPPDINESDYHYIGQKSDIRIGLMQIHGLTREGAAQLLDERQANGPFRNFSQCLKRVTIDRADAERLIKGGCFDNLEGRERRPALLWELLHFHRKPAPQRGFLFEEKVELPQPPGYDEETVLRQELETLGMLVSTHPLTLYRKAWLRHKPLKAREIKSFTGRHVTMIGWWITTKTIQDKHGRPMEFVSFEDTTAIFDATFFPDVYARFCRRLSQNRPYLIKGVVEEQYGVATLRVCWIDFMDR